MSGGRRLRDGGYVVDESGGNQDGDNAESAETVSVSSKALRTRSSALQDAQKRLRQSQQQSERQISLNAVASSADTTSMAKTILHAQAAFTSRGQVLGGRTKNDFLDVNVPEPEVEDESLVKGRNGASATESREHPTAEQHLQSTSMCMLCLAEIPVSNMDMHMLRCLKNPAYHKVRLSLYVAVDWSEVWRLTTMNFLLHGPTVFVWQAECSVCHEKILRSQQNQHLHCSACMSIFTSEANLRDHLEQLHSKIHKCEFCSILFTGDQLADHKQKECIHVLRPVRHEREPSAQLHGNSQC